MTASDTLLALPAQAGGAVLHAGGSLVARAFESMRQAPLVTAIGAAFIVAAFGATSNALFGQPGVHPAPLFYNPPAISEPAVPQIAPIPAPAPVARVAPVAPAEPLTAAADPTATSAESVGNQDVFALQTRLQELNLFAGKVDGYYGPQTATAIRAFELREGLTPVGALSPAIVDAVLATKPETIPRAVEPAQPVPASVPASIAPVDPVMPADPAPAPVVEPAVDPLAALARTAVENSQLAVATASAPEISVAPAVEPAPIADQVSRVELTRNIQRGLASLGFLHGAIDGKAGEATAKAIRNFEVYFNYEVTGEVAPELLDLLTGAGAIF